MNFPKRDELSFRTVFAFPKASKIGLLSSRRWTVISRPLMRSFAVGTEDSVGRVHSAVTRWLITIFTVSVFPAPDSPETKMV